MSICCVGSTLQLCGDFVMPNLFYTPKPQTLLLVHTCGEFVVLPHIPGSDYWPCCPPLGKGRLASSRCVRGAVHQSGEPLFSLTLQAATTGLLPSFGKRPVGK